MTSEVTYRRRLTIQHAPPHRFRPERRPIIEADCVVQALRFMMDYRAREQTSVALFEKHCLRDYAHEAPWRDLNSLKVIGQGEGKGAILSLSRLKGAPCP